VDPLDPSSIPPGRALAAPPRAALAGLRAAVLDLPTEFPVHPSVGIFYEEAVGALRAAGLHVERAAVPELPWQSAASVILAAEAYVAFEGLIQSGRTRELADPMHRSPHGASVYRPDALATDYVKAQAVRRVMQAEMARFFERFDVVVAPNSPILPPPVDDPLPQAGGGVMRFAGNLLGLPAVALPMGFVEPEGLPLSLEIAGPPLGDGRVLALAALFQERTRWHLRRPPA
jgi:aspartyl-tRNA(Asn)/glutamyl-tRNA(Gln) amidotransferase subunit A